MKLSSLLGHVREVLQLVHTSDRPADQLIDKFFRSRKYLGSHDRRFIAETTYGTLRHLRRCEFLLLKILGAGADRSIPEDGYLLLAVTYLLAIDRRTNLKVDDVEPNLKSGDLRQKLGGILRAVSLPSDVQCADEIERIGIEQSFPDWIVRRLAQQYGLPETERLCEGLNCPAPLSLRVNTLKGTVEDCEEALKREGVSTTRSTLSPFGLIMTKRLNVFQLHSFHDGLFEVQDEGSQILPLLLDPKPTAKVLDACAGAGGKTLELSALMKNRGEIVAADIHSTRLEELRRRARRAGASNIRIRQVETVSDLRDQYLAYFDLVLVDAPCSGLGTLRRNPGMKWMVSEEAVGELAGKQFHIVEKSRDLVKPGGILAYATCTLFREENEGVVESFLKSHPDFAQANPPLDRARFDTAPFASGKNIQFLPHRDGTDGFFVAVMKRGNAGSTGSPEPL